MRYPTSLLSAVALVCSLLSARPAVAQGDVGLAAGLRLGYPFGLSVKGFVTDEIALEGVAGFRPYWGRGYGATDLRLIGLYHYDLELTEDGWEPLQLVFGGGIGFRFWNYDDDFYRNNGRDRGYYSGTTLGIRAYVGAQYAFDDVPLELTLDVGPGLGFGRLWVNAFGFHYSAGVRYIISRR